MAKIVEYFRVSVRSLTYRKLRSWLTVIGIIIGIAAIVSLFSLGEGLQNAINEQFSRMGTRSLLVTPKGLNGPPTGTGGLTEKDVETLRKISDFEYVGALLWLPGEIDYGKDNAVLSIRGISSDLGEKYFQDIDMNTENGRIFKENEKFVVVIGYHLAHDFFEKEIRVNNKIKLNNYEFKVIGIFEEQGSQEEDNIVVVPLEAARIIFDKQNEEVSAIRAVVKRGLDVENARAKAEKALKRARGDEDFEVYTPAQIAGQVDAITNVIQIFLVGIAAISLLVGAIGITNSMYTSVLERTREIGIMKAIGASNGDIRWMFLVESGLMGFGGGLVGVLLGVGLSYSIIQLARAYGFSLLLFRINLGLIIFGLMFAFLVGMLAGTLPAIRGAKLKPVDSLRYE